MAVPITVPRLGWSMDEGTFLEWLKADGERVQPGDALFVLENDKAAENVEALDAGILRLGPDAARPGDRVAVGQVLAYLVEEGEEPRAKAQSRQEEKTKKEEKREAERTAPAPAAPVREVGRQAVSPRARRVAKELGIDWSGLSGSGRNGRIRERDVRAAAATAAEGRLIPHTPVRRITAARMVAGVTQAAPVTLTTRVDAANLVNLRGQFKTIQARSASERTSPTATEATPGYTDILLKLTAAALRQHPLLQAQWREEGLFVPERIHLALAVDTEAGLLAPVLRDVDRLTLRQVAAQARAVIALARAGGLSAEQMRGATFTVTNLGMFGVDAFTPIISLPQSAVLGVGRMVAEPVVRADRVVPGHTLTLSLTFDHRVLDGATAARFLATLREYIEQPVPQLVP